MCVCVCVHVLGLACAILQSVEQPKVYWLGLRAWNWRAASLCFILLYVSLIHDWDTCTDQIPCVCKYTRSIRLILSLFSIHLTVHLLKRPVILSHPSSIDPPPESGQYGEARQTAECLRVIYNAQQKLQSLTGVKIYRLCEDNIQGLYVFSCLPARAEREEEVSFRRKGHASRLKTWVSCFGWGSGEGGL